MKRITIKKDEEGHWFVIPFELKDRFEELINKMSSELTEDLDDIDNFEETFNQYMVSNLSNVELYRPDTKSKKMDINEIRNLEINMIKKEIDNKGLTFLYDLFAHLENNGEYQDCKILFVSKDKNGYYVEHAGTLNESIDTTLLEELDTDLIFAIAEKIQS